MSENLLNRDDAPFSAKLWELIDGTVVGAAKSQLCARRLLDVEGPYGLGLKTLPGRDAPVKEEGAVAGVTVAAAPAMPLLAVETGFCLAARDIAAFESTGVTPDLGPVAAAALSCARQEDLVIFNGVKSLSLTGLTNSKGSHQSKLKAWTEVGVAAGDLIEAATKLDAAGFHGPYALALTPERYNLLLRVYPQAGLTELAQAQQIAAAGVFKAPAGAGASGVLIAAGRQFASLVLGQDIAAGFVGPVGRNFEFTVSESLALRLVEPGAVCVLKQA